MANPTSIKIRCRNCLTLAPVTPESMLSQWRRKVNGSWP